MREKTSYEEDVRLIEKLIANWEDETVEFKEAGKDFKTDEIGKYVSALSNEANLAGVDSAWLVFGVRNKTRVVVGTDTEPSRNASTSRGGRSTRAPDPALPCAASARSTTHQGGRACPKGLSARFRPRIEDPPLSSRAGAPACGCGDGDDALVLVDLPRQRELARGAALLVGLGARKVEGALGQPYSVPHVRGQHRRAHLDHVGPWYTRRHGVTAPSTVTRIRVERSTSCFTIMSRSKTAHR